MARDLAWGDVRFVEFDRPDKTRPVVVLTRSSAIPYLNAVTVAPITRTIRSIPTEVQLGVDHGLKSTSVVNVDAIQTVNKSRLGRYLGSVGEGHKQELRAAVLFALELE